MASDGSLDAERPRRVGLVVVHGVGETEPGYCTNTLLDTLSATVPAYKIYAFSEYWRLGEQPPASDEQQPSSPALSFPAVLRHGSHANGTGLTALELHWADLTNIQAGRVNTLLGLFRVIFESHHLVHAMLDRGRSVTAWILRKILWVAGWMLRGPIAALTITTSAYCSLLLFAPGGDVLANHYPGQSFAGVQLVLFATAVYFLYRIIQNQDITWYDSVFWLALTTAMLMVLNALGLLFPYIDLFPPLNEKFFANFFDWVLRLLNGLTPAVSPEQPVLGCASPVNGAANLGACYVNGLYKLIIWGWRVWGGLLLFCTAILFFAMWRARKTSERSAVASISTSVGILILQFMLWTTVVVTLLYPMLNRAETNAALHKLAPLLDDQVFKKQYDADGKISQLIKVPDVAADWIERFKFIYVLAASVVLVFLAAAWVLMRYRRALARSGLGELERTARRMPPLLFNSKLVALLIIAFLGVIVLVFNQADYEKIESFVRFRSVLLPVAAFIALVTPMFFGHRIANVVHIARDLIDHHYLPSIETATYFSKAAFRVRGVRPRRARIQGRLVTLLDTFVEKEKFDDLIFVAHSQGSIVAYDYLLNAAPEFKELGGATPSLLTFGSPLGPIYQKYFHEYAAKHPVPDELEARLRCWVNLYRVDDYIGGRAHPPEGLKIDNRVMPPGGHMYYWSEADVARALDQIIQRAGPPMTTGLTTGLATGLTTSLATAAPGSEPAYVHAMRGT